MDVGKSRRVGQSVGLKAVFSAMGESSTLACVIVPSPGTYNSYEP